MPTVEQDQRSTAALKYTALHQRPDSKSRKIRREELIMKISKNMKTALEFIGKPYKVQTIDLEQCLYRNLHNGYDIEVSGINRPQKGYVCNFIQVWDIRNGLDLSAKTVEKFYGVKTLPELKILLDQISEKYGPNKD